MATLKKKKMERRGSFLHDLSRPSKMTFGFEWEIKLDLDILQKLDLTGSYGGEVFPDWNSITEAFENDDILPEEYVGKEFHDFQKEYEIDWCFDGGGLEFTSPVFHNLVEAKRWAKRFYKVVQNSPFFDADSNVGGNGIHVHVSYEGDQICNPTHVLYGMPRQLALSLTGRANPKKGTGYTGQAYPDGDREFSRQSHYGTTEFRMWAGKGHRLEVALEFAHAVTHFQKNRNTVSELGWENFMVWLGGHKVRYRTLREEIERHA